jgi:cytoskeletal protein CcmA (bactofilin family)
MLRPAAESPMSSNDTRAGRSRCVSEAAEQNDLVDPTSNAKESGGSMSAVTTEKLLADFRVLIDDVEQLVSATAGEAEGASPSCVSIFWQGVSKREKLPWPSAKRNCANKLNGRKAVLLTSCEMRAGVGSPSPAVSACWPVWRYIARAGILGDTKIRLINAILRNQIRRLMPTRKVGTQGRPKMNGYRVKRAVGILIASVSIVFLWLAPVRAQPTRGPFGDRSSSVAATETVQGDYFGFGRLVTISGTVNGDVYAFGGQIVIDGKVNGDLLVAGGRVSISGDVSQDVRVGGGQVNLSGAVGRNLTAMGGNVELARAATVGGSVVAAGGNIHLASPVKGAARIAAGSLIVSNTVGGQLDAAVGALRLTSNAEIAGNVNYYSRREAEVEPGARIGGKLVHNPPPRLPQPSPERIFIFFTGLGLFILLTGFTSTLILGLLSLHYLPKYHQAAADILRSRPWVSLGLGFVAAIVIPVVCAILFSIVLTIPIAVILAAAFGILLFWARIFVISRLGEAIMGPKRGWAFLLGLVLYYVIAFIPIVGWIFVVLVILSGLGAELLARKNFYLEARARELL